MGLKLLFPLFILIGINSLFKAQAQLEGIVLDQVSNQALDRIHIANISNQTEVLSNAKGEFKITAAVNDLLVFKALGYCTDTILITSLKPLKHYLKTETNTLKTVNIANTIDYSTPYAQTLNKANAVLLKPGRGLLFYPSGYFSREGKQARKFKRMLKNDVIENQIDKRFNTKTVTAILPLKQPELDAFMITYRPALKFVRRADDDDFKFYLLDAYHKFKLLPAEKRVLPALKLKEID